MVNGKLRVYDIYIYIYIRLTIKYIIQKFDKIKKVNNLIIILYIVLLFDHSIFDY